MRMQVMASSHAIESCHRVMPSSHRRGLMLMQEFDILLSQLYVCSHVCKVSFMYAMRVRVCCVCVCVGAATRNVGKGTPPYTLSICRHAWSALRTGNTHVILRVTCE